MTRLVSPLLLLLLAVAACADRGTVQGACEAQSNDDPLVKAIILRGMGNPHAMHQDQEKLRAAKQDAFNACLRARGALRGGGVERQKPL